ncbi:hypothetical protein EAH89_11515 [Roseomonas nepalensis]|uniref:Uncharacterized protein n=1 Tax=Muricoccus nepalensis TaxID=1854500 RepID=A0A502G654_9PROT|nr:hypothetical protein EAH89_11515 [Roseomonas nepalensis]
MGSNATRVDVAWAGTLLAGNEQASRTAEAARQAADRAAALIMGFSGVERRTIQRQALCQGAAF